MRITHAEAHRLIQSNLDRALTSEKQRALLSHLQECDECKAYNDGMHNMENMLRQMMNKQWQHPPLPLSLDLIRPHTGIQKSIQTLFGLRTALVSVVLIAFSFLVWQLKANMNEPSKQMPFSLAPIPTPSIQISTASLESPKCKWSLHKVGKADTLDRIAHQYSVSKDEIMTFNNLTSELIYESLELKIPLCNVTPTVTAQMPTTTLTPMLEFTVDTPG